jgi:hypothetical protein
MGIQVSAAESEELEHNGVAPRNSGFKCTDKEGKVVVEYHVDCCKELQERCDTETRFGSYLIVHLGNDQPLLSFGHDEAVSKQYTLTKSAWVAPDGTKVLLPKDEGQGWMISAFQSREFRFGMPITEEDLIDSE